MKRIFRFFKTNLRLGLRVVKTGIAVTFCVVISSFIHLNQPMIAVIATVISMGKSIDFSVKSGKNKMFGALIGSAIGALFAMVSPGNAGLCGIGVILSLYLCHFFHLERGGVLSSLCFSAVMFGAGANPVWRYALSCTGAALLGIAVAVVVNLTVMPPNYADEIKRAYEDLQRKTAAAMESAAAKAPIDTRPVADEIECLSQNLHLYTSEARIFRWNDEEVFRISSSVAVFRLVLDELKAVASLDPKEEGEPSEEIRTVYQYHMRRMRELVESTKDPS